MTTLPIDLTTAAYRWLMDFEPFTQLIADGLVGSDAEAGAQNSEILEKAWVFQGLTDDGKPYRDPEGTGACVVVLSSRSEWSTNDHNTALFPVLQVLIYADSSRDTDGAPTSRDAENKCKYLYATIDRRLHILKEEPDHWWSAPPEDFYVISCTRAQGLQIMDVPLSEGYTVRGEVVYNTVTG